MWEPVRSVLSSTGPTRVAVFSTIIRPSPIRCHQDDGPSKDRVLLSSLVSEGAICNDNWFGNGLVKALCLAEVERALSITMANGWWIWFWPRYCLCFVFHWCIKVSNRIYKDCWILCDLHSIFSFSLEWKQQRENGSGLGNVCSCCLDFYISW